MLLISSDIRGAWADDRPSTPHRQPARCSDRVHDRVCRARERTGWGPRLIASELQMSHATVWRCLRRRGALQSTQSIARGGSSLRVALPRDLLQMDVKRFARFSRPGHRVTGDRYRTAKEKRNGPGWEFCHSIIDDHSRLVYSEMHGDEQAPTVTAFVERALVFFAGHGITAKRLQTDNAFAYVHNTQPQRAAGPPRHPAPPHPTAHPEAQREGREIPTDARQRVGLRAALPLKQRQSQSTAHLAQPLQHQQESQRNRRPATHQPRSEPPEAEHLGRGHRRFAGDRGAAASLSRSIGVTRSRPRPSAA